MTGRNESQASVSVGRSACENSDGHLR